MSFSCECYVLTGSICDGLITRPEESYRVWCVSECNREASILRRPWPTRGRCATGGGGGGGLWGGSPLVLSVSIARRKFKLEPLLGYWENSRRQVTSRTGKTQRLNVAPLLGHGENSLLRSGFLQKDARVASAKIVPSRSLRMNAVLSCLRQSIGLNKREGVRRGKN
jgi:hypothetical protein